MNSLKYFSLISLLIISITSKSTYDTLVEWGKNNSLKISNKLEMRYISENNKSYYAKETIEKGEELLTIPYDLILTVEKSLDLIKINKLTKIYEKYKKEIFKNEISFLFDNIDQSFIAYLIFYINNRVKKYKKNKFYQFFNHFFNTFESNLDSYPIYYNEKQQNLLQGSISLFYLNKLNSLYKEEIEKIEKLSQKDLPLEEYLKYRTLVTRKTFNISNHAALVPFIDMFKLEPKEYNVDFILGKDNSIKIFAAEKIKKGGELLIRCPLMENNKLFVLYGKTFENLQNYVENFDIPIMNLQILNKRKINQEYYNYDFMINLAEEKFYEEALDAYKDYSKRANDDGSDFSAYKYFLENLEYDRSDYNLVSTSDIYKEFYQMRDIDNVKRVLAFEKRVLEEKIDVLKKFVSKLEKEKKDKNEEE